MRHVQPLIALCAHHEILPPPSPPTHTLHPLLRIFSVLGHPSVRQWPDLEHMHHWHHNTENVRIRRDTHPTQSKARLACALPLMCTHSIDST